MAIFGQRGVMRFSFGNKRGIDGTLWYDII